MRYDLNRSLSSEWARRLLLGAPLPHHRAPAACDRIGGRALQQRTSGSSPKARFPGESDGESLANSKEFRNWLKLAVDRKQASRCDAIWRFETQSITRALL
jgi:hypothetical protein